jgi:ribosomal-protein-serine acetyltransferase
MSFDPLLSLLGLPEELTGDRVVIRPYRLGDGQVVWQAVEESRAHLRPWLPWARQHQTPEETEAFLRRAHARWLTRESFDLSVWSRDGHFLGGLGLHPRDWDVPSFEIGYWIRTSAEGKGFVTEAVWLACRLAFERLGANRVHIQCDPRNVRSAAVPRRVGFLEEARLRNHARTPEGALRDTLIFAMTPPEFSAELARREGGRA